MDQTEYGGIGMNYHAAIYGIDMNSLDIESGMEKPEVCGGTAQFTNNKKWAREPKLHKRGVYKFINVRQKGCIKTIRLRSLNKLFSVPKAGKKDTHMIYNGLSSVLNWVLWDPHFSITTL